MNRKKYFAWAAIAALLSLTACENPKEANKENFKVALNQYFKKNPACLLSSGKFPIEKEQGKIEFFRTSKSISKAEYDALVTVGLLEVQVVQKERGSFLGSPVTAPVLVYDLADKGKKSFKPDEGFCYGTREVTEIVKFTEPSETPQGKAAQVAYKYRTIPTADWADKLSQPELAKLFPNPELTAFKEPQEAVIVFVLTNEGWEPQQSF
ncbi:hypothetical protein ACQ4M3_26565 [Leptolyngbya sp. AN03gr2]|uniref:hypothetical protein n=1 Tax=unclassified Leptolyngbya TaxID=2650499 RepID=UPI003D3221A6